MSPEAQRIAIAEACGVTVCPLCWWEIEPEICHCGEVLNRHGMETGHNFVPNGCTCGYDDADKLRHLLGDVEDCSTDGMRKAPEPMCENYLNDLNAMREAEKTIPPNIRSDYLDWLDSKDEDIEWNFVHATAAQRAEAFLRTIGKWEDA